MRETFCNSCACREEAPEHLKPRMPVVDSLLGLQMLPQPAWQPAIPSTLCHVSAGRRVSQEGVQI